MPASWQSNGEWLRWLTLLWWKTLRFLAAPDKDVIWINSTPLLYCRHQISIFSCCPFFPNARTLFAMSIKLLSPLICGREECKLFLLKLSGVKMRVIMADSMLSSPTDDYNEKPAYKRPLPSCLSTGTQSKLPCHLSQIVSDCAKNREWIQRHRQPRSETVMAWQKTPSLFGLRFRFIPHRFPRWPWEELHLSAERSQWQHRSIDLGFVLPSVDTRRSAERFSILSSHAEGDSCHKRFCR